MEVKPNTTVQLELPRLIEADDYHEFQYIQRLLRNDLKLEVYVTEVGFSEGQYIGLVHLDTPSHNQLVMELERELEEEDE